MGCDWERCETHRLAGTQQSIHLRLKHIPVSSPMTCNRGFFFCVVFEIRRPPPYHAEMVARCRLLCCTGRSVVPIGEDPAAYGHWCTFTDLYHTMSCHAPCPMHTHLIPDTIPCASTMPYHVQINLSTIPYLMPVCLAVSTTAAHAAATTQETSLACIQMVRGLGRRINQQQIK